jgi:prevent-host-death family protein
MATIPQKELRNSSGEILRRAEAGETITVTVSGRPVAQIGPITRQTWIPTEQLAPIWQTPAPKGLDEDLAGFDIELDDPYAR